MNALTNMNSTFEGHNLTTIMYQGEPCWIAKEIGNALGYANEGKRLIDRLSNEWKDEFIDGEDFIKIEGKKLVQFKELMKLTPNSGVSHARHITLLFEPGLYMVMAKTSKPVGKNLRRFIASEVMPQIKRDGNYLKDRSVVDGQLTYDHSSSTQDPKLALAWAKEQRLQQQLVLKDKQLVQKDKQMKVSALKDLLTSIRKRSDLSPDVVDAYEVSLAEMAAECELSHLKPQTEETWLSPTQIAKRLGLSTQRVGLLITELGIRGNIDGISKCIVNKAKGHQKTVESYLYTPKGEAMIKALAQKQGRLPRQEPSMNQSHRSENLNLFSMNLLGKQCKKAS